MKFAKRMRYWYIVRSASPEAVDVTVHDVESARKAVLNNVQAQRQSFSNIIEKLQRQDYVTLTKRKLRRSPVLQAMQRLTPFMTDGILGVVGRLQRSHLPESTVHPEILPAHHQVTKLIIEHYHQSEGHSGTLHVLAAILEKYWIIGGQSVVRTVIRQCLRCRMQNAKPGKQMMQQG